MSCCDEPIIAAVQIAPGTGNNLSVSALQRDTAENALRRTLKRSLTANGQWPLPARVQAASPTMCRKKCKLLLPSRCKIRSTCRNHILKQRQGQCPILPACKAMPKLQAKAVQTCMAWKDVYAEQYLHRGHPKTKHHIVVHCSSFLPRGGKNKQFPMLHLPHDMTTA